MIARSPGGRAGTGEAAALRDTRFYASVGFSEPSLLASTREWADHARSGSADVRIREPTFGHWHMMREIMSAEAASWLLAPGQ